MRRWLITGAGGMLGAELKTILESERPQDGVNALARAELDISDPAAVRATVRDCADASDDLVVINCAAHTNVDSAESDEKAAHAVNAAGPAWLAATCAEVGARMLHLSTDYVFGGADATEPYAEDAPTAPVNVYGRTKLAGEQAVLEFLPDAGYVVRTSWLYGAHGSNFVSTVLAKGRAGEQLSVVSDQIGQPTWTRPVAHGLLTLADSTAPAGIYHATAAGEASRYDQARAAFELAGLDPDLVRPSSSADAPRPAPRPSYTALAHTRWDAANLPAMDPWRIMLTAAFAAGAVASL